MLLTIQRYLNKARKSHLILKYLCLLITRHSFNKTSADVVKCIIYSFTYEVATVTCFLLHQETGHSYT